MIEERVQRLRDDIKALKTSMPISGSLLETYFYTKTSSATYADGATAHYTIKFVPTNPQNGLGITELFEYCEGLATGGQWAQYNPVFLTVFEGYYVDGNGNAVRDESYQSTGFGTYEVKVTASVYSTVPGNIQITFS